MTRPALTLLTFILLPFACFAQFAVSGRVINADTEKPVAGVSIFFNNATFGDASAGDGSFRIGNIKSGQYQLVVTAVGYETYVKALLVSDDLKLDDIHLKQKVIGLKEVKIHANFDREKYYEIFKKQLLGSSENAKECKILNPDVLYIDYDDHVLTVNSDQLLEIENKALGYKIKYLLQNFVLDGNEGTLYYFGYVSFENLPGSKSAQKRWEKNRLKVYLGSEMHFFRTLMGNQLNDDGFKVLKLVRTPIKKPYSDSVIRGKIRHYRALSAKNSKMADTMFRWVEMLQLPKYSQKLIDTPALGPGDMLKRTDQKILFALSNPDCLYVMYTKRSDYYDNSIFHPYKIPNHPITIVSFRSDYVLFDINGAVVTPDAALLEGYWGGKRVADSLPVDYEIGEADKAADPAGQ
ncbi:MAG TPA: carboxypeptidase-like regulatory domain-containing protein [Mucilaginibacter sp.]|nr:carboxypeptidase-like regulatory domain-containing protein [Mucilaginibacter sp.]